MSGVGKICRCGEIVMPHETHACAELENVAAIDNARRHAKQREHGRDTAHWSGLRAAVLIRCAGRCEVCGGVLVAGHKKLRPSIHLDPRLEGHHELATLADVVVAHASCHGRVDAPRSKGGGSSPELSRARPAPGTARISARTSE